jgi:long-chain acyl-CoA synthetase
MGFRRLFDAFYFQKEHYPQDKALSEKIAGKWVHYSTNDVIERINTLSRGLYHYGIRPGDKISIISANRSLWTILDHAALQIGAIVVPVYPNISQSDYQFIFNDSGIRLVFVQDKSLWKKIEAILPETPGIEKIFTFNEVENASHWSELLKHEKEVDPLLIESIKKEIRPEALATIIYTSGTTGQPKGVMLSHKNVVSNAINALPVLPIKEGDKVMSSLPLCHIFERMVSYIFAYAGCNVYYVERVENIAENLREVKPHFFTTVPRLLEKMYERIMEKAEALKGFKKKLFDWSMKLTENYQVDKFQGVFYEAQLWLARKLVFSKWREALGGEIVGIMSGAAALQPRLQRIFNAAGIKVREGYGQTETSPVISVNRFERGESKIGTVGRPIPNVKVKIEKDGEICVKGDNVMLGYYNRPDLTAQVIDEEGWLHTGDVGEIDAEGYLKITDRKKELFKTSGGKSIAPQVIENKFKESPFIEQIMVLGENRKTISALIVPAFHHVKHWLEEQNIHIHSKEEIVQLPEVQKKFTSIRDGFNRQFSDVEKVKRFILLPQEWNVEGGELTPTLKLKRKIIMEKYKEQVAELYREETVEIS